MNLHRTPVFLTFLAVGSMSALGFLNSYGMSQIVERPQNRQQGVEELVRKLYLKIAGDNRIQERDEKRKALDDLGFIEFIFDEAEPLKFSPTKAGDGINIYFGSGNFDRYVGTISLAKVEDYLKTPAKKK